MKNDAMIDYKCEALEACTEVSLLVAEFITLVMDMWY